MSYLLKEVKFNVIRKELDRALRYKVENSIDVINSLMKLNNISTASHFRKYEHLISNVVGSTVM